MAKPQISLKARALRYLAAREHSRLELARKLERYAQETDDIEALLDSLEAARFLSETRFAESLVHRRAARYGNNRILSELQSHQLDGGTIAEMGEELVKDEEARARAVWERKYGQPPVDAHERAKHMRFLLQRGFSHRAIQGVMRSLGRNREDFDE